jgi:molecular chaperone GrpE (heat shock protein)
LLQGLKPAARPPPGLADGGLAAGVYLYNFVSLVFKLARAKTDKKPCKNQTNMHLKPRGTVRKTAMDDQRENANGEDMGLAIENLGLSIEDLGLSVEEIGRPSEGDDAQPGDGTADGSAAAAPSVTPAEAAGENPAIQDAPVPDAPPSQDAAEPLPEAAAAAGVGGLINRLDGLQDSMNQLAGEFQAKLKYDAHKERIIDSLHQELQEYKNDIVKKHLMSVLMDVIKVIDDIRKWMRHYRSLDSETRDPVKIFKFLETIPSDLEDIFYWQGVKSFICPGDGFDPTRQRAAKKVATTDPAKDKKVAESLRYGYEWEGKVIRPEMVAVYDYKGN